MSPLFGHVSWYLSQFVYVPILMVAYEIDMPLLGGLSMHLGIQMDMANRCGRRLQQQACTLEVLLLYKPNFMVQFKLLLLVSVFFVLARYFLKMILM